MAVYKLNNSFDDNGNLIHFDIGIESLVTYREAPLDDLDDLKRQQVEIKFAIAVNKYLNKHKAELIEEILKEVE